MTVHRSLNAAAGFFLLPVDVSFSCKHNIEGRGATVCDVATDREKIMSLQAQK